MNALTRYGVAAAMLSLIAAGPAAAAADHPALEESKPGFIVAAPDRGFLGNEETRAAFAVLDERHPAALVFVTDERTRQSLHDAIEKLVATGVGRAVLLPLYLSTAHPDFRLLRDGIADAQIPVRIGRSFGQSALAVATLADRFETLPADARRIVVAGIEEDGSDPDPLAADLQRLAASASDRFEFPAPEILLTSEDPAALAQRLSALDDNTIVVPFHLGKKHDSMMSHTARVRYAAPATIAIAEGGVTPHPAVGAWLLREAARHTFDDSSKIGVIVHAHGSDFHWNERMRQAAVPLTGRYLVEYAFSMADPVTLRTATDRLVQRGAEAVVLVRVFGMAESFRAGIERLIGTDYESCQIPAHAGHAHHGHGHANRAPRIVAPVPIVTVGGLQDHPLFARALLDRARALSQDPVNETVIVVAHGKRDDADNAEWMEHLESIRRQMQEVGSEAFNAIEIGTWREDWADKREPAVARIRALIEQAAARGDRVIIVPARTNAQGPARRLIPDLDYALAEGFAGHPLFAEWLDAQVRVGVEAIKAGTTAAGCPDNAGAGG